MSDVEDGGPAWPSGSFDVGNGDSVAHTPGMSLRDWFAGQALAGLSGSKFRRTDLPAEEIEAAMAEASYALADAMLAERAALQSAAAEAEGRKDE